MSRNKYRSAIVTGGSSGIGYAFAENLVKSGADVAIIARGEERLLKAKEKLEKARVLENQKITAFPIDLSSSGDVKSILGRFLEDNGAPDLLVNSAGIAYPNYFEEITYEKFTETMNINVGGTWNTLSVVVPYMKKVKKGYIINISSIAGFLGFLGYGAYSTSKFAVFGLSEVLRNELKPHNIHVSVLCPPDTDTPQLEEERKTIPMEAEEISGHARLFTPEYVAKAGLAGAAKKQFVIVPGFMSKIIYLLKRVFPSLVFFFIDGDVKKALKKGEKNGNGR